MRRDRPQASRSRHRWAGRPILSPLIPGCSVAGDQDLSRFLIRARCRVGVRNVSSPHQGRDLPRRALREDGCWRRMAARPLEQPGVLLLRRLGPQRAERVTVAMFGLSLVWACSSACRASAWSVGLAGGHGGRRICLREGVARRSASGGPYRSAVRHIRSAASAAGIPAVVTNIGRLEDPRTTGTGWVAVWNRDLATPVTGMPDSASR